MYSLICRAGFLVPDYYTSDDFLRKCKEMDNIIGCPSRDGENGWGDIPEPKMRRRLIHKFISELNSEFKFMNLVPVVNPFGDAVDSTSHEVAKMNADFQELCDHNNNDSRETNDLKGKSVRLSEDDFAGMMNRLKKS